MSHKRLSKTTFFFLGLMALVWVMPLVITISNSFMTETEMSLHYNTSLTVFDIMQSIKVNYVDIVFIPTKFSLEQYKQVLMYQPSYLVLLVNSLKITVPVVIGNSIVSLLTSYGLTIWKFKHKGAVLLVYTIVMLMPLQAVLVPNYVIADILHMKESYLAIILPGIFAPFGTFLLTQSMKSLPVACLEAASMDNAGALQIFFYIVCPQMKSGLAALAMLTFIEYWNVVDQAVVFIREYYRQPLSVYLSHIPQGRIGVIFAASCVYMFFPLWFLLLGQKDLEKGIELSGLK